MIFDSTPNLSRREHLSQVIRYVDVDFVNKQIAVIELFIEFIEIHGKYAAAIEEVIIEILKSDKIPLNDCRSQCYDNAAVMSGHISAVQQSIFARDNLALFVHCDNHSLHLWGCTRQVKICSLSRFLVQLRVCTYYFSRSTL